MSHQTNEMKASPRAAKAQSSAREGAIRVLLIDEQRPLAESCVMVLVNEGYEVRTCHQALEARALVQREAFDVILLDAELFQLASRSIMAACLQTYPATRVIVMSSSSSVQGSLDAIKSGAWSYLAKPFSPDHLRILLGRARHEILNGREDSSDSQSVSGPRRSGEFLGRSPAFMRLIQLSRQVAATSVSVLLTGESGSGKEMIAQFIHQNSRRRGKQMVAINCAALPETLLESEMFGHVKGAFTGAVRDKAGLLEIADGGTLFLDELTEMPLQLQAKLLRVIQDGKLRRIGAESTHATVSVRFIAATNRDPLEAIKEGTLRRDLYYRLGVVPIHLPPLRDRVEDIPQLAQYFLEKYWAIYREPGTPLPTLSEEAIASLCRRPWPGNVRELQNVMEHSVVIFKPGALIEADDLPFMDEPASAGGSTPDLGFTPSNLADLTYHEAREQVLSRFENTYLRDIFQRAGSNLSKAAKIAGVDRTTLYRLMEKHGLDPSALRAPSPRPRSRSDSIPR